ncbi:hypothetical protein [Pseudomonas sp. NPDC012596]|uniref:hypothetical protein n=1 Tax=Pseudomonas sp. NPDC012596 TaxID=3364419 RepID=UPI00368CADBC
MNERKAAEARQFMLIEVQFFAESNLPMAQQHRGAPSSLAPLFKSVRPAPDDALLRSKLSEASYGFFLSTFEGQLHSAP